LEAIKDSDLALVVRPVERASPTILDDVRDFFEKQRPLAALLLPPISERADLAALCAEMGVRYVRVGSAILDDERHSIASNDRDVVQAVCKTLIDLGHRRFGFVRGPQGFRSAAEREAGFLAAMSAAGIAHDASMTVEGNYRFESGIAAGEALLSHTPRPTAIFAGNDEMAAGVVHAARQMGIQVPDQLSIIGFDDSPTASHIWPPLSTIRWPIIDMGRIAAQKLVPDFLPERADKTPLPDVLDSTFIDRMSIAPPQD
jgi:LacI family transcriptional regulator